MWKMDYLFKRRGFFLADALKCRCNKGNMSHPSILLAKNCGRNWLGREISFLNPDRICALGKTALGALGMVQDYEKSATMKAGEDCGIVLNIPIPVLVCVFPSSFSLSRPNVESIVD